jgi:hypothetical protein
VTLSGTAGKSAHTEGSTESLVAVESLVDPVALVSLLLVLWPLDESLVEVVEVWSIGASSSSPQAGKKMLGAIRHDNVAVSSGRRRR